MKNKKGFTMIELLATIVILGVISTIGVVSINRYVRESRQKAYKLMSSAVYEAAMNCVVKGKCVAPTPKKNDTEYDSITTDYLKEKGFIKNLKNPISNKEECSGKVTIFEQGTSNNEFKDFYYEVSLNCPGYANATLIWPYSKTIDVSDTIANSTSNENEFKNSGIIGSDTKMIGSYVNMTPTKNTFVIDNNYTGYSSTQTITPSELTLWRIIRKNSDGSYDAVSHYLSSDQVRFTGRLGFANYIGYLNVIAKQYENSIYTSGSRYIGYDRQIEFGSTTATNLNDTGYKIDTDLIESIYGNLKATIVGTSSYNYYALATRNQTSSYGRTGWISSTGTISYATLYSNTTEYTDFNYLRPIIVFKQGINIREGKGTIVDPYILSDGTS